MIIRNTLVRLILRCISCHFTCNKSIDCINDLGFGHNGTVYRVDAHEGFPSMDSNRMYQSRYREVRIIGSGTSGRAILVFDTRQSPRADPKFLVLKEIIRPDYIITLKERIQARREVEILSNLRHSNVIRYMDSFEELGHLYIVTEFANRG